MFPICPTPAVFGAALAMDPLFLLASDQKPPQKKDIHTLRDTLSPTKQSGALLRHGEPQALSAMSRSRLLDRGVASERPNACDRELRTVALDAGGRWNVVVVCSHHSTERFVSVCRPALRLRVLPTRSCAGSARTPSRAVLPTRSGAVRPTNSKPLLPRTSGCRGPPLARHTPVATSAHRRSGSCAPGSFWGRT